MFQPWNFSNMFCYCVWLFLIITSLIKTIVFLSIYKLHRIRDVLLLMKLKVNDVCN